MPNGPILDQILSCPSLPSPPAVAIKVLELTRDPRASLQQIGKLVQNDTALSAKILKTVNSSLFGLPQQCTKIDRALGLLGLNAVKSLVLGFSLVDGTKSVKDGNGIDLQAHWRRAVYSAAGARNMALATKACDPDEAFTGALFQDIGVMAAVVGAADIYAPSIIDAPKGHTKLAAHEREKLGLGHPEIGAALAERWKLPSQYIAAIRYHHEPNSSPEKDRAITQIVHLGGLIAEAMATEKPLSHMARLVNSTREWFGKGVDDLEDLLERVASGAKDLAKLFEKDVGLSPNIAAILAEASEQSIQTQIAAQRESEALKQQNDQLAIASVTDGLTKIRNRKAFDADLAQAYEDAKAANSVLAAFFIDGDKFKSVNDRFGHPAGDAVLVELARRLSAAAGPNATVYRYGGEEFAVLAPGADAAAAATLAESLRRAIESPAFDLAKVPGAPKELPITISVGVAITGPAIASPVALVKAADEAVYASKQNGRNRVTLAGHAPTATTAAPATPTPATPSAAPPAHPPATASATPGKLRVLLVDDDALAGKLLQIALQKRPTVEVVWAWNAPDALAALAKGSAFHAIITDMHLGNGTGLDVARAAAPSRTPVLLISAAHVEEHAWKPAGVRAFVSKRELCVNLNAWIERVLTEWTRAAA